MDIVEKNESFHRTGDKIQFDPVTAIIRKTEVLYLAKWKNRRGPEVRKDWMVASTTYNHCYTCEVIRNHPHPNVASYYGCRDTRGRVSGLCFKRYTSTLSEKVSPHHLNKTAFLSSNRLLVNQAVELLLASIRNGIRHLHALGLVHNDITPSNIMLDDDGTAVIIDFDSCRQVGALIRETKTKRTHGWHDPNVNVASETNDLDALAELRAWLLSSSATEFQFA
ncbi:kinase-like domain-containing protein [Pseudomassariella vexata]|uniref:EKC/KEOPS complex subunit BUD32 n=1 Tax=Pseudomassariella vexata TaxID=1141098 RepID=A0A1Y2DBY6_9PEZI|nr:kinase-like domain-containing protein [Pseudomassariella vexata]ORY56654.1 kinase-like domain-containing protein [Pseudomassariella vexata]